MRAYLQQRQVRGRLDLRVRKHVELRRHRQRLGRLFVLRLLLVLHLRRLSVCERVLLEHNGARGARALRGGEVEANRRGHAHLQRGRNQSTINETDDYVRE